LEETILVGVIAGRYFAGAGFDPPDVSNPE
jgi:hypothetical protein